ncbi:MAG: pyridoxamine 5'-phosphate oxidase [Richelia sp. RM2_1_2]|nr:pyridoxamine 5'-phosphate oxidase [Richelia sp. SM2_1_7]NJM22854.1 pyridoxamine 5'-phosphate oxidase [Richelia sp. SM1_7_0]NJN09576.1 pyridoxamine 5'-phosphate oxidase [Richelia sp. RM1_1_1]NJO29524.1 pyridoxamine 5'-phosphate oxidase [Richelia sp. SL_2_1]NJO59588.1 pyridoxamine 5'-phosphate oxidase [Richelia sp. RM2_1_2]
MSIAPWRSFLANALRKNRNQPHSRYFQLATVRSDGTAANRTLVFRGFLEDTNKLKIITDTRSEKITEINNQSRGEICWYFTTTREQFRIAGNIIIIDANHHESELQKARESTWQELSDNARIQFAWAHPGKPRGNPEAFSPPQPDANKPLDNFCLLLFEPVKVDHLRLRGEPQNRTFYIKNQVGIWDITEVNP